MEADFLPMSREEAGAQGLDDLDIIVVSGDAYVDHPLFCTAVVGRILEAEGYTVGVIAQPDWRSSRDFTALGAPRLFFAVTAGNVDSMVNHYTPALRRRKRDEYSPGGMCRRPDRATIVYSNMLRASYPETPIVIGGIEASLRRFAHYDYWTDRVRQSVLADTPADILVYGMGERQLLEIARRLGSGCTVEELRGIHGTVVRIPLQEYRSLPPGGSLELPSYARVAADRKEYARAFSMYYREQDPVRGRPVLQLHPKCAILQYPPAHPLETHELDRIYELPYAREPHPAYRAPIPALEPVRFSIVSHRGCIGECRFCALVLHQGRIVQSRSAASLIREAERIAAMPGFRGVITDVGGPSANMYGFVCGRWREEGTCPDRRCIGCPSLEAPQEGYLALLRAVGRGPGVKKVFVGSGVRYDLFREEGTGCLEELCRDHVSGHLKVAPEHISPRVTQLMGKPPLGVFETFRRKFEAIQAGKRPRQYLVPYFMSGHPGCTVADMVALAEYIRDRRLYTEQVQDFTPTPMTASTVMYHTGLDPFTLERVHVPKGREKAIQRALLHYRDPRNYRLVREGLLLAGRGDLIGNAWKCLIPSSPPDRPEGEISGSGRKKAGSG